MSDIGMPARACRCMQRRCCEQRNLNGWAVAARKVQETRPLSRIQTAVASASLPARNDDRNHPPHAFGQPDIQRHHDQALQEGARNDPNVKGLVEPPGFFNKAAPVAGMGRTVLNTQRLLLATAAESIATWEQFRPGKSTVATKRIAPYYSGHRLVSKFLENPLRVVTTIKAFKEQGQVDQAAHGVKLSAHLVETNADALLVIMSPKKGAKFANTFIPFQRGHRLRTPTDAPDPQFPMKPLHRSGTANPAPRTEPRPSPHSPATGEPVRVPVRTQPPPQLAAARPASLPLGPAAPSHTSSVSAFARDDASRVPVRMKQPPPPRLPTPPSTPSSSTGSAVISTPAKFTTGVARIGTGAAVFSSFADIYFGVRQVIQEREPAGKLQGALFVGSGLGGVGSGGAGFAATFGVPGAAGASTMLGGASLGLAVIAVGMSAIPAIHGRDNRQRAIKLFNDARHEVQQMGEADKQLSRRINVGLTPELTRLEQRYGASAKQVWLNNNAADFLNQVNSPNNTTSGQWKPDQDGNVWSSFRGKYIRIEGTPHQNEVELHLPAEKGGSRTLPVEPALTVPGDSEPVKKPLQLKGLAAEPRRYQEEGWSASTRQAPVIKHYGYQTSDWGQHWETNVPFSVHAGPMYVSHPVSNEGKDTVVLIDDTPIERPEKPVPRNGYSEKALFANDGEDREILSARQVAALLMDGKPATRGNKFNVAASTDKAEENTYREAVYPSREGTSYIRSPDPFQRVIVTDPDHRTIVSLQNVTHPTHIVAHNAGDIIDVPATPRAKITISLPAVPAGAVDERRLGLSARNTGLTLKEQSLSQARDGKNTTYANTYLLGDGGIVTVQADDPARIERFVKASA